MKFKFSRVLSFILVLALIINIVPVGALAQEIQSGKTDDSTDINDVDPSTTDDSEIDSILADATILTEVTENRTEYSKEYKLSNGLQFTAIYPSPIHYEYNGKWQDIDNSLVSTASGGESFYTNASGKWSVQFPQKLTGNNTIRISQKGHTIQFGMAGELHSSDDLTVASLDGFNLETIIDTLVVRAAQAASAQLKELDLTAIINAAKYPETVLGKLYSRISYTSIYPNTDVVYDLQSNKLKESVVLQHYDENLWGYRYTLDTGDLIPSLGENQQINLCDPTTNEIVFVMPAPYLIDNNGVYNDDVTVSLVEDGNSYLLSYYLPKEWLADNSRAWPVVLDPIITESGTSTNIQDSTVGENYSGSATSSLLQCGYSATAGAMRFYMQFQTLPTLTSADIVVNAQFSLYKPYTSSATANIEVHKVNEAWSSSAISWDNQPSFSDIIADYTVCQNAGRYQWDITELVYSWYEDANYGMMFKVPSDIENGTTANLMQFYSSDYDDASETMPILSITYRNNDGLEDYWDYTSTSVGRAGTGYINNFTGNLTWVHTDLGFDGNRMPVSISHIYNAGDCTKNSFGVGYGWRTNYHQTVELSDSGTYYIWTDGDGTRHEFYYNSSSGAYLDEDGLQLTLTVSSSGYVITDKYDNTSTFDSYGRLTSISNNQSTKSTITISYSGTSKRITQIKDGAGRIYKFTYSSNLLTRIGYYGTGSTELTYVTFAYTSSKLTTITYKDSLKSTYTYRGYYLLSAKDAEGYKVGLTYSSGTLKRVVALKEYYGSTVGNSVSLEFSRKKVKISDGQNSQINYYNDFGNLILTQDDQGNAQYYRYSNTVYSNSATYGNRLTLESQTQKTTSNFQRHSSFESGNLWTASSTATCATTTEQAYLGSKSLKVTYSSAASGIAARGTSISVPAKKTCTFSAYVKSSTVSVQLGLGTTTSAYAKSYSQGAGSGWTRVEVSYTNNSSSAITVYPLLILSTGGIAYIDCVQTEISSSATSYNLIQNGDFSVSGYWSSSTGRTTVATAATPLLSSNVYKLTGDTSSVQYISQVIPVSGSAGDVYVLSGWGKGNSVPETSSDRQFGLVIMFNYTSGAASGTYISFNTAYDSSDDWKFAVGRAVASRAYSSITVKLVYSNNANTAYFDGIQLHKEDLGTRYSYTTGGDLYSVTDILGQTTKYTYNSTHDATQIKASSGATTTNTYSNHNLKTTKQSYTSPDGTTVNISTTTYSYDSYGNQTKSSTYSDGVEKITSAAYTSSGNFLSTITDEMGNVTTYEYDPQTSVLLSVKYPKDTDTTKTKYSYDSMYRLISTAETTDQGKEMSAEYEYTKDLLTKITTKTTTYHFAYGDFSQRTSVSVGSTTLATYTYTDDVYRRLKKLDYGNDDSVEYEYDDLGRVIKETYYEDGSTSVSAVVRYAYDNTGVLALKADSETGVTTKYYYDNVGRSTGIYESGSSTDHRIQYSYDDYGRVSTSKETISGSSYTTKYVYYGNDQIYQLTAGNSSEIYLYDEYSRLDKWYTYHNGSSDYLIMKNIHYAEPDDRSTSNWPEVWSYISSGGYKSNYNYTYDANGNIKSAKVDGNTTTYVYDTANQLIRENNQAAGKTWVWTYDAAGNIKSKKTYAYTTGTLGSVLSTVNYTYGDSEWGDLLTKYGSSTITYDDIGNPLTYGSWTYTWEKGRRLATATAGSTTWTYTYNDTGMRTERTNGNATYTYTYNGSQLSQMTYSYQGSFTMHFYYDANGNPMSFTYSGGTYYYVLNLQGDVVAILNSSGEHVVGYTYDAWGKLLTTTGSMASTLGLYNPLRYRGYVYDRETSLYYLQSRYYNPTWGRFINADSKLSTGQGLLGNNMFAYCLNNPVTYCDTEGESATIAGAVIGGIFGAINGIMSGGSIEEILACAATGAITGAIAGFAADISVASFGVGGAIIASAIAGGLCSSANSAISQSILNDGTVDPWKVASDGIFGAVAGGLCTSMSPLSSFQSLGLREGIAYAKAMVAAEEIMLTSQAYIGSALLFDIGATAVTSFGGWISGLAYDYYAK